MSVLAKILEKCYVNNTFSRDKGNDYGLSLRYFRENALKCSPSGDSKLQHNHILEVIHIYI